MSTETQVVTTDSNGRIIGAPLTHIREEIKQEIDKVYADLAEHNSAIRDLETQLTAKLDASIFTAYAQQNSAGSLTAAAPRLVPLALTLGQGDMSWYTKTTDYFRIPLQFNAPISRWRLHLQNINPRTNSKKTGAVPFVGIALGDHKGDGRYTAPPEQIHGAFTSPANADEWVSPWFTNNIGDNQQKLLELGFKDAPTAPVILAGGGFQASAGAGFMNTQVTPWSVNSLPFSMWIEAQTPARTPVYAVFGDSLSVGIGAKLPVFQSPLSLYMRQQGGLPIHYAASGDTMTDWITAGETGYKVNRWDGLTKADLLLFSMGSNDVFAGLSLVSLQERFKAALALMSKRVASSAPIYLTTIYPRNNVTGSLENTRRSYNSWLKTQLGSGNIQDIFDTSVTVSADDENLKAEFADRDGVHLNEAAYSAISSTLSQQLTQQLSSIGQGGSTILSAGMSFIDNGDGTVTLTS